MRSAAPCLLLLLACSCALHDAASPGGGRDHGAVAAPSSPFSLDRLLSGPSIAGAPPSSPTWSPDGSKLAFRWGGPDGDRSELWLVDSGGSGLRALTEGARAFAWTPDSAALLYARAGELWRVGTSGNSERIAELGGSATDLTVSPDGARAAFRRDGDLWIVDLQRSAVRQLTHVGEASISRVPLGRYRRADVEIGPYIWGGPTYAWSPDSRTLAVHHVDRRQVRAVPFPHYLSDETDPNPVRRGYPGQANEARTVGLVDVASGALRLLDLAATTATRVVDFSWSKSGRLLIDRESDTAVDRWLHVLEPGAAQPRTVWHDQRASRVYTSCGAAWHPDDRHLIVLSDRADRYGLYAIDANAQQAAPRLLTSAASDVTSPPMVTRDGVVYYQTNDGSPYERHVCRTTLDGAPVRLTSRAGEWRPYPAPTGDSYACIYSNDAQPAELFVGGGAGAAPPERLTTSTPADFAELPWAEVRYATFPSHVDGATLHARILEPRGLDRSKRHPVLFGPVYSNTVRNRWGGFYAMFQQLLVARGYVVVQVDVRGSTGYGRAFREAFLADFAGRDLDDLESAVRYVESLPYVDPDAIGVWGSSYGGTLTAYALLKKPGLFDAGVACAAAVDPFFFGSDDVAIVRTPDERPDAFARGAAQYADALEDPLLLIHGMQDQVVPFKTAVSLAEALMRAGKDFDFAFAPAATHGWTSRPHYARYLLGKLIAHFDRHLRGR